MACTRSRYSPATENVAATDSIDRLLAGEHDRVTAQPDGQMMLSAPPAIPADAVIKLTYANFPPAATFPCVQMEHWAKEVEKRTGGKVKVQTFPGGTLLAAKNILDGVISGLADIGNFAMSYQPGRFPVSEVVDLPLGFTSAKVASLTLYDLVEKYQPKEFEKVKILTLFTCPPADFMTSKPVRTLKDLKGMELRVSGTGADVVKNLGGIPIATPRPGSLPAKKRSVPLTIARPPPPPLRGAYALATGGVLLVGAGVLEILARGAATDFREGAGPSAHDHVIAGDEDGRRLTEHRVEPPEVLVVSPEDARRVDASLCPGIVKSARMGYDGKGQIRVATRDDVAAAWTAMGGIPCIIDAPSPFHLGEMADIHLLVPDGKEIEAERLLEEHQERTTIVCDNCGGKLIIRDMNQMVCLQVGLAAGAK